jgi:hypothetical protein
MERCVTVGLIRGGGALAFAVFLSLVSATPAAAQTDCAYDMSGEWVGETSGNRVTIEMRPGGFVSWVSGTPRPGQSDNSSLFRSDGPGSWSYSFPNGQKTTALMLGPGLQRITNPDGWSDKFKRVTPAPECRPGAAVAAASTTPAAATATPPPLNPAPRNTPAPAQNQAILSSASPSRVPASTAPSSRSAAFPSVVTAARSGTGCVTASLRNLKPSATDSTRGEGDWVLSNSCPIAQVVLVDVSAGQGYAGWPAADNAGAWASTANADRPAGLAFAPIVAATEKPKYIVPEFGEYVHHDDKIRLVVPGAPALGAYVASCDVVSRDGFEQVVFRASPSLATDSRAGCGPSRLRSQRPEAIRYAYEQGNAQGNANFRNSEQNLQRYKEDVERYENDLEAYQADVAEYQGDVAAQQQDVAAYNAAQEEYRRKQVEYQAELERARKAREEYEAKLKETGGN